jgi:ATP-dependent DNA helicase RecQ
MLYRAGQDNLARLRALMDANRCPADLLADLYGGAQVDLACGGCNVCRADPTKRHSTDPRREPAVPWSGPPFSLNFASISYQDQPIIIHYDLQDGSRRNFRVLREVLSGLVRFGLRRIAVVGNPGQAIEKAIDELANRPVFVGRGRDFVACRLPPGPHLLVLGEGAALRPMALQSRKVDQRIILSHHDLPSPYRPDIFLRESYEGPIMRLEDLHARIGI